MTEQTRTARRAWSRELRDQLLGTTRIQRDLEENRVAQNPSYDLRQLGYVQSSQADVAYLAAGIVTPDEVRERIVLQTHDEVIVEVPESDALTAERVAAKMANFGMLAIPAILPVEFERLEPEPGPALVRIDDRCDPRHAPEAIISTWLYADYVRAAPPRAPRLRIAGRPIAKKALGWLVVLHDPTPVEYQNRRSYRRWFRRFGELLRIAGDALEQSGWEDRRAAVEVLCEMISLQAAVELTEVPRRSRWVYDVETYDVQPGTWSSVPLMSYASDDAAATLELVQNSVMVFDLAEITPTMPNLTGQYAYMLPDGTVTHVPQEPPTTILGRFVSPATADGTAQVRVYR